MAEAKINETCIIGLPTCGYAFSGSRMAFIAAPSDDEFRLELDIVQDLLAGKDYEAYIAVQRVDPAKLAFCTKICSKIIQSQFCVVLLNASRHHDNPSLLIPNPNVHLEYGLMLAFKKHIIPLQREGDTLAFNIRPLDTILYANATFKGRADRAIDSAILAAGTTSRSSGAIVTRESLLKYITIRGLQFSSLSTSDANTLYRLGSPLGFLFLEGREIVWFGLFDQEPAKEVVFRLKLLLQNLHNAKETFERERVRALQPEQVQYYRDLWQRFRIEVFVSPEVDKGRIEGKVRELAAGLESVSWHLLNEEDVQGVIRREYEGIGDV